MRTQQQHLFSQVPKVEIPRSAFNRTCTYKTTFDSGYLVPFFIDEVLPGDTFQVEAKILARLATPIFPTMDNLQLETFYFFVPNRLVWDNWQKFMGEKVNPTDTTEYSIPQLVAPASTGWAIGSLSDYFGIPTGVAGLSTSSLWHRAYNLIYNEWFRDENLQNSLTVNTGDSADSTSIYAVRRINKFHDYFTSCLPWPQKGPGVSLPLGTSAPVKGTGKSLGMTDGTINAGFSMPGGSGNVGLFTNSYDVNNGTVAGGSTITSGKTFGVTTDSTKSGLVADLTNATAATINSLRSAFQLQRMYERDARGGTRYIELLKSHFGVTSPDFRLQRPEFLGGGKVAINITPVMQTSSSDVTTPQGHLSGFGVSRSEGHAFTKSFTEHGMIIGLVAVRSDLTYQQGLPRMFSRTTRYDYYWPALAHLGEQAVLNKELYAQNNSNDNLVFGYQERYAEYRYGYSKITGKLRSTASGTLHAWHYAQQFTLLPTLSDEFIQENAPVARTLAVQSEPQFIMDCFINNKTVRPMPVYSVPGMIDHF